MQISWDAIHGVQAKFFKYEIAKAWHGDGTPVGPCLLSGPGFPSGEQFCLGGKQINEPTNE